MDRPGNDGGAGSSRRAGRAVQAINRHLGGEAGSSLASRVSGGAAPKGAPRGPRSSGPLSWIKVSGLMQSKAASNIHNGLRDLVSFLERKSTSLNSHRRQIVIKKVGSLTVDKEMPDAHMSGARISDAHYPIHLSWTPPLTLSSRAWMATTSLSRSARTTSTTCCAPTRRSSPAP
jgi:nuclear RNA export factor